MQINLIFLQKVDSSIKCINYIKFRQNKFMGIMKPFFPDSGHFLRCTCIIPAYSGPVPLQFPADSGYSYRFGYFRLRIAYFL